jgi:RNA polymerase primary sigma factor
VDPPGHRAGHREPDPHHPHPDLQARGRQPGQPRTKYLFQSPRPRALGLAEIAQELEVPVDEVDELLKMTGSRCRLDAQVGEDGDSTVIDFVENPDAPNPADASTSATSARSIDDVLAELTPREEKVIRMRYGIGEPTHYSLEEIGSRFALTRERIRQIEIKALRKLRHTQRKKGLEAFLEAAV